MSDVMVEEVPKPAHLNMVPVAPLRLAFEESGLTATELASRLGWESSNKPGCGNGSRMKRVLGLSLAYRPDGSGYRQVLIHEEIATAIVDCLGLFPVDVGL